MICQKNLYNRINNFRLLKNGLLRKFQDINSCVKSLCGIQSQILNASYISLFNRVSSIKYENVTDALYRDKYLVRAWGQRGTLHLFSIDNWNLIISAISEDKSWFTRKVEKHNCQKLYQIVFDEILNFSLLNNSFTRSDLLSYFNNHKKYEFFISSWGGILIDMSQKGLICQITNTGTKVFYSHQNNWISKLSLEKIDSSFANLSLLNNFIESYGPVEISDFAFWRGITKSRSEDYFKMLRQEFNEFKIEERSFYIKKKDKYLFDNFDFDINSIILLYRFDPILLSYKNKSNLIKIEHYKKVWRVAGHIEGVILKCGFIIGSWSYKRLPNRLIFDYTFFNKVSKKTIDKTIEKSIEIGYFLGINNFEFKINNI